MEAMEPTNTDMKSLLTGMRYIAAKVDKLSQEDHTSTSADLADIHTALSNAQATMKPLVVDTSGYTGKYVSLPAIIAHIQKPLTDNELSYTQEINEVNGRYYLLTTLRHSSGQWINAKSPLFFPTRSELPSNKDFNQECGKAIAYMRRYALESMLGLKGDTNDYDSK